MPVKMAGTLLLTLLLFMAFGWAGQPVAPLGQEAEQRHGQLVKDGFNLTYGYSWSARSASRTIREELLVPGFEGEHRISLWLGAEEGDAVVRLVGKDGRPLFFWSGSRCEKLISRRLPPGKYCFEIDFTRSQAGFAELGVKGPLITACTMDPALTTECPASPSDGFHWPYLLRMPKSVRFPCLLVAPNNTGTTTEDPDLIRASASCDVERQSSLADRLGCVLLVPLFPRPVSGEDNLYLHALTRESLLARRPEWKRVDLQLLAMIRDARARLERRGQKIDSRILLTGFSASGSFVGRFAMLHPREVLAVASVSPGGWPIAPVREVGGERLPYPVGLADLETLSGRPSDPEALKAVHWLMALGDQDANDSVPFRDSFSRDDEKQIFRLFGNTLQMRWKKSEALYRAQGLQADFRLYPGAAHLVTPDMKADIARFFEERLQETFRTGASEAARGHGCMVGPCCDPVF